MIFGDLTSREGMVKVRKFLCMLYILVGYHDVALKQSLRGLVVWHTLRVREVSGSIPDWDRFFLFRIFNILVNLKIMQNVDVNMYCNGAANALSVFATIKLVMILPADDQVLNNWDAIKSGIRFVNVQSNHFKLLWNGCKWNSRRLTNQQRCVIVARLW